MSQNHFEVELVEVELVTPNQGDHASAQQALSTWVQPHDHHSAQNAAEIYLQQFGSLNSVRTARSHLNQVAKWFGYDDYKTCDWQFMRYENVVNYINHLKNNTEVKTTTVNACLVFLKGVSATAWKLGQISDNDYLKIQKIKQYRVYKKPSGQALTKRESEAILDLCDSETKQHIRDRAILLLLLNCGLRRAEVTTIELKNVFLDDRRIRLVGKGNKERDVYLNDEALEAVKKWIDLRQDVISQWNANNPWKKGNAGDGSAGYLFGRWTRNFNYLVINRPLAPETIARVVDKYKELGKRDLPKLARITTHDLRRTFATRLLNNDVDINVVRQLMGHSNISTTSMYDHRGDDALKAAVQKL